MRRPSWLIALAVAGVASLVIALPVSILLLLAGDGNCGTGAVAPQPSASAQQGIPADYLKAYMSAGEQFGLPWTLLAAIGSIETDHGRLKAPGVLSGTNSAGAAGPMQFLAATFAAYAVDGNNDGQTSIYDPQDAIPSAAKYLRASGAPGDLHKAIFAYNHAEWYVQKVLANMRAYDAAGPGSLQAPSSSAAGCEDLGGLAGTGDGTFKIAPGANKPGQNLTPELIAFVRRMASFYDGTLVITTGTNHDQYSLSGNVSDHFSGNAADFGMVLNGGSDDGPVGDRIAAAAFLAAGLPRDAAVSRARAGGAQTVLTDGLRVQVIWKSDVGGNHHNHVHVGIARR